MTSDLNPLAVSRQSSEYQLPKVAIVSHTHPSLSKGGAEIATYALFKGLRELGIEAIYISACNIADRHRLSLGDANEFGVYYDGERYEHFYHLAPRSVVDQIVALIRGEGVGVVNFHHFLNIGLNSLRAVRGLTNLRCFFTFHEFLAICHHHGQMITRPKQLLCVEASPEACIACFPENLRSEFVTRRENVLATFRSFDGFIAPSHFLAGRYTAWGLPKAKITVIENGLIQTEAPVARSRSSSSWTFGFFGQINPFKGVDVLLDAVEILSANSELAEVIRFRIHGNLVGQSEAFTERFEKSLRTYPFLTYAGPYNNTSVHRLMSDCDYVVVPSKWWENSPLVIQEAFSAGVPVLCSGIGGMAEKVPDGVSGLHFRVGDPADLLRAVRIAANAEQASILRAGIPLAPRATEMAARYADQFRKDLEPTHLRSRSS